MAILNYSDITKAIETLLRRKLTGFNITRNQRKNADPNRCIPDGWIGIYRGPIDYNANVMGSRPWLVDPEPLINVQVVGRTGDEAENNLQDAEEKVINIIESDRTLGNTVSTILGYSMEYEYNTAENIYYHGVNIKIKAQTRA